MKLFTTGDVARICKVAPRTVSKWFDSGLLKGWRIPGGSRDRRIPENRLREFLAEHGMPTDGLEAEVTYRVLVISPDDYKYGDALAALPSRYEIHRASNPFQAGLVLATVRPQLVLTDEDLGRAMIEEILIPEWCYSVMIASGYAVSTQYVLTTMEALTDGDTVGSGEDCHDRDFLQAGGDPGERVAAGCP